MPCRPSGGQNCRGVGADPEESRDADIEQPREAPLHIEAEGQHGVDAAHGEQRDRIQPVAVKLFHQNTLPLNRPDGRQSNMPTIIAKATPAL